MNSRRGLCQTADPVSAILWLENDVAGNFLDQSRRNSARLTSGVHRDQLGRRQASSPGVLQAHSFAHRDVRLTGYPCFIDESAQDDVAASGPPFDLEIVQARRRCAAHSDVRDY